MAKESLISNAIGQVNDTQVDISKLIVYLKYRNNVLQVRSTTNEAEISSINIYEY